MRFAVWLFRGFNAVFDLVWALAGRFANFMTEADRRSRQQRRSSGRRGVMPIAEVADDERCQRCGGFGWTRLHQASCVPPISRTGACRTEGRQVSDDPDCNGCRVGAQQVENHTCREIGWPPVKTYGCTVREINDSDAEGREAMRQLLWVVYDQMTAPAVTHRGKF